MSNEVVKWKIRCEDQAQFLKDYAPKLAGPFFVAMPVPLSRGTNFAFQVKFSDGAVRIKGLATVLSVTEQPKLGVLARFISLESDSIQFPLAPVGDAQPPSPAPPPEEILKTSGSFPALPAPSRPSAPRPPDARPTPPSNASLELLAASPIAPIAPVARLAPAPQPLPPPPTPAAPAPAPSRRPALFLGLSLALLGLLGGGWYGFRAFERAQQVDHHLARYEQCVEEGRMTGAGGDTALDHLLAARALAPSNARVQQKSVEMSRLFGLLAQKALDRGDDMEASLHLQALVLADPNDTAAAEKLKAAEARVRSGH